MNCNLMTFLCLSYYLYCCYCFCCASLLQRLEQQLQQQINDDNKVEKDDQNNDIKKPWELLEAIRATQLLRSFNGTWLNDEEFYYITLYGTINKYNVVEQSDEMLIDAEFLDNYYSFNSMMFSPDLTKALVRYDVEEVFRHSTLAKYDIYDIKTKNSIRLRDGKKLQHCLWSPQTNRLSFVYKNNVYVRFSEGYDLQITSDGLADVLYNGVADWVYEEEVLSGNNAMWWSPDGQKLAVGTFDDSNVHTFTYFIYGESEQEDYQYPREVDLKYPKSGSNNPVVAVKVVNLSNGEPRSVIIKAPVDIVSSDHILQHVTWVNQDELLIVWLNRRQNICTIQVCTVEGDCREIKRLTEPNGWIVLSNDLKCLKGSRNCLFSYWIGDWYQVWNLDLKTGKNIWSSRGNFTVLTIYGYDEEKDILYYQATLPQDPSNYQIFANDQCLSCSLKDKEGDLCRSAVASFSKNFTYYMITCNGPNPSYSKLFKTSGNVFLKDWESNDAFRLKLSSKQRPLIQYLNVSLIDGSQALVKLLLPPNLDKQKKYPLIVDVYGGPNSVKVTSSFTVGFESYMTTKRQVIYARIDGRGTGNKGKTLLFSVNNHLGEFEVEDQIYVSKYLQKTLPYVDKERTGIWGWSYGGYMTARTLSHDNDRVFRCGISVAPVTSWLYYDSIYTERYMGLPTPEDNLLKYISTSVLHDIYNFRTHDFLLIHGSADDNVHYQQSLLLAKVLQQHDIMFDEMTYTDENHAIGNLLPHLYNTMDHFWINCLNLEVSEDE